jgi:glycosyltransferase involved in cell wall biosynthesis
MAKVKSYRKAMRLLILTQKVDSTDAILGFFHAWLLEFAKYFEKVTVVCLYQGEHNLPQNVTVLSLGKEKGTSRLKYILNFYRYIWREKDNYDTVFVHMNPIYVVLGGLFWRFWGKKIGLWYTHKSVDLKLYIATFFANIIFSASHESFKIKTHKLHVLGHGIDLSLFDTKDSLNQISDKVKILHVGRITPIKNLEVLVEALSILKKGGAGYEVILAGAPATKEDESYKLKLEKQIEKLGLQNEVKFLGNVRQAQLPPLYKNSHLGVNLAPTGGIDKAVLESLISGVPVFVSNLAFREYLHPYENIFIFKEGDAQDLVGKIMSYLSNKDKEEVSNFLKNKTIENSSLENLIKKIAGLLE